MIFSSYAERAYYRTLFDFIKTSRPPKNSDANLEKDENSKNQMDRKKTALAKTLKKIGRKRK